MSVVVIVAGHVSSRTSAQLLPSANDIWDKVMFSQACVSHSVHGRGGLLLGGLPRGGLLMGGRVCLEGVCILGVWGKVIFSEACVSHSVHGEGFCMMSLPVWLSGPTSLLGGLCPGWGESLWGLCPGQSLSRGCFVQGGLCRETPKNQKSGWYASYWNAFLVFVRLLILVLMARRATLVVAFGPKMLGGGRDQ